VEKKKPPTLQGDRRASLFDEARNPPPVRVGDSSPKNFIYYNYKTNPTLEYYPNN